MFAENNPRIGRTLKTHLIDIERAGVLDDDYDRFFNYRCRTIARELARNLIPQNIDEQGQAPSQDDYEDLEMAQRQGLEADEQ